MQYIYLSRSPICTAPCGKVVQKNKFKKQPPVILIAAYPLPVFLWQLQEIFLLVHQAPETMQP